VADDEPSAAARVSGVCGNWMKEQLRRGCWSVSFGGGMKIKEHDCVVLRKNLPEENLEAGDVGTVVHIHKDRAAYEVEFATLAGSTVAVATVEAAHLRPVGKRDLNHVRELQPA